MSQHNSLSRRAFLRLAGVVGGATAIAACTIPPPQPAVAEDAPKPPDTEGQSRSTS